MRQIFFITVVTMTLLLTGCKTVKDLISLTPFWWVINRKQFEHTGDLRNHAPILSTHNYLDNTLLYEFRIDTIDIGTITYRIEEWEKGDWKRLPGGNPRGCDGKELQVVLMATDNNRLFVIAENDRKQRSLWWYCMKRDQAKWAGILINAVGDFMKPGYAGWFTCAHSHNNAWINLLALREFVPYIAPNVRRVKNSNGLIEYKVDAFNAPRSSIDVDDIVDITVGHWTGTVVTYYVLMGSTGKIMYIDEEIVMDRWKEVPNTHRKYAFDPGCLNHTARIAASNSVICAYHHIGDSAFITWIRWDFHNKQDFEYFPLNWCDSTWRRIPCPVKNADHITIDTHWPVGDAKDTIWNTPNGIDALYNKINTIAPDDIQLKKGDLKGFLGSYRKENIAAYRMHVTVTKGDSIYTIDFDNRHYADAADRWTKKRVVSWE